MIPPIEVDELKTATVKLLCNTWKDLLNSDKIFRSEYQVFGVLTFCRMLYTLEIGEIVTKPQAVLWAKKKLGPSIEKLLDEALKWKPSEKFDHLEEIKKLFERIIKKYCN